MVTGNGQRYLLPLQCDSKFGGMVSALNEGEDPSLRNPNHVRGECLHKGEGFSKNALRLHQLDGREAIPTTYGDQERVEHLRAVQNQAAEEMSSRRAVAPEPVLDRALVRTGPTRHDLDGRRAVPESPPQYGRDHRREGFLP